MTLNERKAYNAGYQQALKENRRRLTEDEEFDLSDEAADVLLNI